MYETNCVGSFASTALSSLEPHVLLTIREAILWDDFFLVAREKRLYDGSGIRTDHTWEIPILNFYFIYSIIRVVVVIII